LVKRLVDWSPVALGLVFLAVLSYYRHSEWLAAKNDFVTFYAGAKLAGTPDLYSRSANLALNEALAGSPVQMMMYIRPPFYAALLKPLSLFPYLTAYAIFSAASLGCVLWFVSRFSKECPSLPFLASISIPLLATLCAGQDSPLLLVVLGGSILLMRRNLDFAAGLLLSLCAIKFHLFLLLPLVFVLKKRWGVLRGGSVGVATLLALGALVNGPRSYIDWVNVLRDPWINPHTAGMPNLHGLVAVMQGSMWLEASLAGVVVLAFFWVTQRTADDELLLAAALVCGLLLSFHSTLADEVLLLPILILVLKSSTFAPLRVLMALILTPVPYFMVLAGEPYSAVLPVGLLLILAGLLYSTRATESAAASPEKLVGALP
jgi:hypothetical protein